MILLNILLCPFYLFFFYETAKSASQNFYESRITIFADPDVPHTQHFSDLRGYRFEPGKYAFEYFFYSDDYFSYQKSSKKYAYIKEQTRFINDVPVFFL